MNKSAIGEYRDVKIRITNEQYENIRKMGATRNRAVSPTCRDLINKGLAIEYAEEYKQPIQSMLRSTVEDSFEGNINRIMSIISKNTKSVILNEILIVELLSRVIEPEEDLGAIMKMAREEVAIRITGKRYK
mgnify:CR=1 FL=1